MSNFSLLPLNNFVLDLAALLWPLPAWSTHHTASVWSPVAQIVQFNPIEVFERRSSSRAELSCVFTLGHSCLYIQYKTYLFYSYRISWSYVQPVDHFPKTPSDVVISWCDSVKLFFTVPCRTLYLTSQNWVILFCRGFPQCCFFLNS